MKSKERDNVIINLSKNGNKGKRLIAYSLPLRRGLGYGIFFVIARLAARLVVAIYLESN